MKKTPLNDVHRALGAKMVEFGGWDMPVQYPTGLIQEHNATRTACGLFDVSHMGEINVKGTGATKFLQEITCNDVAMLEDGKAQYSAFLNEAGGIIDDLIVYRNSPNDYFLCVNASNTESCVSWLSKQIKRFSEVAFEDVSSQWGQIAVQGPKAWRILDTLIGKNLGLKMFRFKSAVSICGASCIVARTGYTGEDGAEIFIPTAKTREVWDALVALGGTPCGLGARDTLRLEAGLSLHGHELLTDRLATTCGISWAIKINKGEFLGREALLAAEPNKEIIGFELTAPGIARHGDTVVDVVTDELIGVVTSGTRSPTLGKSIVLAYVNKNAMSGNVVVRGNKIPAIKTTVPFYKKKGA